jgi:hypothetical protein
LSGRLKRLLLAGASAFCWVIWLSRNDIVFDKFPTKTFCRYFTRNALTQVLVAAEKE